MKAKRKKKTGIVSIGCVDIVIADVAKQYRISFEKAKRLIRKARQLILQLVTIRKSRNRVIVKTTNARLLRNGGCVYCDCDGKQIERDVFDLLQRYFEIRWSGHVGQICVEGGNL